MQNNKMTRLNFYVDSDDLQSAKDLVNKLGVRTLSELFRRMIRNYSDFVEGKFVPVGLVKEAMKSISRNTEKQEEK